MAKPKKTTKTQEGSVIVNRLYLIFWLITPVVWMGDLIDKTLMPRQLYAAVFLLVLSIFTFRKIFVRKHISSVGLLFLLFFFISAITSFFAINQVESLGTLARYGLALTYLLFTIDLLQAKLLNFKMVLKGIVLMSAVTALFTLTDMFKLLGKGDFFKDFYEIRATFSHKNLLSAALMLCLPFVIAASALFDKTWRILSVILLFLIIIEILILRTRGVWLASGMALIAGFTTYYLGARYIDPRPKMPLKIIGAGAIAVIIVLAGLFSSTAVRESFTERANLNKRTIFWENSLEMIKDHPIMGVGAGNWRIHFPKYGLGDLDNNVKQGITNIQRPHNDYLWVWTEGGPLALLVYLLFFAAILWQIRFNIRRGNSKEELVLNTVLAGGVISYMVFSFSDFPMERMEHLLLLMTMAAFTFKDVSSPGLAFPKNILKYLLIVLIAGGLYISYKRLQGEKDSTVILEANARQDANGIIRAVDDAENPLYEMDNYANPLRYFSALGKLALRQDQAAMADLEEAVTVHPNHMLVLNLIGTVYRNQGNDEEALKYFDAATDISPNFVQALTNKADLYMRRNEYGEAMEALTFVAFRNENPRFRQLLENVLPVLVREKNQHNRYPKMIAFIESKNPRSREDYIRAYREFRAK